MNSPIIMTKYEFARIKGIRLQQLADGFDPLVETKSDDSIETIFEKELKEKKVPLSIIRKTGYNSTIEIPVSSMIVNKFN